jgi:hypothetical protein
MPLDAKALIVAHLKISSFMTCSNAHLGNFRSEVGWTRSNMEWARKYPRLWRNSGITIAVAWAYASPTTKNTDFSAILGLHATQEQ